MTKSSHTRKLSLSECVDAFEQAIADGRDCALGAFLPDETHPEYNEIVIELVRVDMELKGHGKESTVARYCEQFPSVFSDPARRAIIAFEEYRCRRHRGESITPQDYSEQYRIETSQWPTIEIAGISEDVTPHCRIASGRRRILPLLSEMKTAELRQCVAEAFPEFEPVEELGRGTFGRVFLARQKNLAGRFVVIKVTSDTTTEPERLAKLQHTNIMPVYSVHRTQDWQAICMPFFGRRTLKDFPKSDIQASLRLVLHVAEGLEHAHRNGILHRDVKPANILVTDDGQPLLLDFNLSSDVTAQTLTRSIVGGTIPYLAPEQLESLKTGFAVAASADLYSLGVILYERITGELPYEASPAASLSTLIKNAQDRREGEVPRLRDRFPQASVAVQDILLKCLQPAPADRYQSATELADDLRCELDNLPLKHAKNSSVRERIAKWRRRHPKMLSVSSLVIALIVVLVAGGMGWAFLQDRIDRLHARAKLKSFQEAVPVVRTLLSAPDSSDHGLDEGLREGEAILKEYRLTDTTINWRDRLEFVRITAEEQRSLDEELSEIVYLMASACQRRSRLCADAARKEKMLTQALHWNSLQTRFESAAAAQQPWNLQRASINIALGLDFKEAITRAAVAEVQQGQISDFLCAIQLLESGEAISAEAILAELVHENPHDYSAWYLLGKARQILDDHPGADAAFSTCIALNSECWVAWQDRAVIRIEAGRFQDAAHDCSQVLIRRPELAEGYLNRAIAETALGEFAAAEKDLTRAIQCKAPTRAYFLRSNVRQQQGNINGAQADYQEGLTTVPNDCDSWLARGMASLQEDPQKALADFTEARTLNRLSRDALQNSAHVLSERLNRSDDAIRCLDELLRLYPEDNGARIRRAVLNARAARDGDASHDAEIVIANSPDPVTTYQIACVFSQLSVRTKSHRETALRHLTNVFNTQPRIHTMAEQDADLNPIRDESVFLDLMTACRLLSNPRTSQANAETPASEITVLKGE